MISILEQMKNDHCEGQISDRHYVGLYLIVRHFDRFQSGMYGVGHQKERWRTSAGADSRLWEERLTEPLKAIQVRCSDSLYCICFQEIRLRFVSVRAQQTWHRWSRGEYPITLIHTIPTSHDMLISQAEGKRWISLLHERGQHLAPIERFRDAFEFLIHDLEHAHHFFSDTDAYFAQIGFYARMRVCLDSTRGLWVSLGEKDPLFREQLHYALSDMNSHVWHLVQYMNAITIEALLRTLAPPTKELSAALRENLLNQWCIFFQGLSIANHEHACADRVTEVLKNFGYDILNPKKTIAQPDLLYDRGR